MMPSRDGDPMDPAMCDPDERERDNRSVAQRERDMRRMLIRDRHANCPPMCSLQCPVGWDRLDAVPVAVAEAPTVSEIQVPMAVLVGVSR